MAELVFNCSKFIIVYFFSIRRFSRKICTLKWNHRMEHNQDVIKQANISSAEIGTGSQQLHVHYQCGGIKTIGGQDYIEPGNCHWGNATCEFLSNAFALAIYLHVLFISTYSWKYFLSHQKRQCIRFSGYHMLNHQSATCVLL